MRFPQAFDYGPGDSLVVLDPELSRLNHFHDDGGILRFVYATDLMGAMPATFCMSRDGPVFLHFDPRTSTILHTLRGPGPARFGEPLFKLKKNDRSSAFLNAIGSIRPLSCARERSLVVFAPTWLGQLLIIPADRGTRTDTVRFPEFRESRVVFTKGGGVLIGYPDDPPTHHSMASLVMMGDGRVLVQFGLRRKGAFSGQSFSFERVHTRIVDLQRGTIIGKQDNFPVVLDIRGDQALLAGGTPGPWVRVARISFEIN